MFIYLNRTGTVLQYVFFSIALTSHYSLVRRLHTSTMSDDSTTANTLKIHGREEDDDNSERPTKRSKSDDEPVVLTDAAPPSAAMEVDVAETAKPPESMLPPSHSLLDAPPPLYTPDGSMQRIMETDVGISEYIGRDVPQFAGIIKQR